MVEFSPAMPAKQSLFLSGPRRQTTQAVVIGKWPVGNTHAQAGAEGSVGGGRGRGGGGRKRERRLCWEEQVVG